MMSVRTLMSMAAVVAVTVAGCSSNDPVSAPTGTEPAADQTTSMSTAPSTSMSDTVTDEVGLFDGAVVHDIEVSFDVTDYDEMINTFTETGDKEWIEATVTIDGATYEQAGLRLKGNSSLAGIGGAGLPGRGDVRPVPDSDTSMTTTATTSGGEAPDSAPEVPAPGGDQPGGGRIGGASADIPEELPWLVRLDEFVAGQEHQGYEDIVIRSNSSATSLNEAVALDLLSEAGLASQEAMSTTFSVNGSAPVLRLAVEHPDDDAWSERVFASDGALYKAESTGDWSYRGDDFSDYEEVWDQEGGSSVADLTPLIEFLRFLDESDDGVFASELPVRLDIDGFARYLAMMDLVENFDDIDGPGNNAYLWYDVQTEQFTVVPWDMNLAFSQGAFGGGPGRGRPGVGNGPPDGFPTGSPPEGFPNGGSVPEGFPTDWSPPDDFQPPGGTFPDGFDPGAMPGGGAGGFGRSNVLVERFHANADFEVAYQQALADLRAELYDSGVADGILARWVETLQTQATELVDQATITQEADAIAERFVAE